MAELEEYSNDTILLSHINVIMPLISLMSAHFLVNAFTLITDMGTGSTVAFAKVASEFYLQINRNKTIEGTTGHENYNHDASEGYLIMGKTDLDLSKVVKKKPKIIVAIYRVEETDPIIPNFLSELVIPPPIAFFVVPLLASINYTPDKFPKITLKCLRLYKPISYLPLKALPTMFYGGLGKPKWTWESSNTNWHSFAEEVRNMSGVNITIGLVSHMARRFVVDNWWRGKYSFFWRITQEHLHYRYELLFRKISFKKMKTSLLAYRDMLVSGVDGLAALPVITSERNRIVRFVLTGVDLRYDIMVRMPQYVHSWNSIFKPLSHESWICLGIAILLISITLRYVTRREESPIADLPSCFLTIFGFVCSQGCPSMPTKSSGRLVCYVALLFSILIYQFYTSNFYSLLSTKEVTLPFNSAEEFMAKRSHQLFIHPESAVYSHIMTAKSGTFKRMKDMLKSDPSHQMTNDKIKKCLEKVCEGTAAVFGIAFQMMVHSDLKCQLVALNSGYFPGNTVTILRKTFPFMSQFKFVHLRLKESGITQKYRDEYYTVQQQNMKMRVGNEPVAMSHVTFLYVLHLTAVLLSWVILGLEIMTAKALKRKKIKKAGKLP